MRQQEYLEILTDQLRCKKAKEMVQEEIRSHIQDQKEAYMEDGMDEAAAEEEAVRQMGDPAEAGVELDRVHRPKMAWDMIILVAFLGSIGLLVQYLLKVHFAQDSFMPSQTRAVRYFILGNLVMVGICMMDYTEIGKWAKIIYLVLAGVNILGLLTGGRMGTHWICIPFMENLLNLTGLIPLFVPLYGAILYSYRGQGYRAVGKGILWALPVFLVTLLSLNISMTAIIGLSFGVTLAVAVYKNWFTVSRRLVLSGFGVAAVMFPAALFGIIALFGREVQKRRLQVYLHPFQMGEEYEYGRFAPDFVANNQWIGGNPLLNVEKWADKLPGGNDYTLAYVASYYGILAAVVIAGLIAILFLQCIRISILQRNQLGMIMGTGCAAVLMVQFILYVFCNVGILPMGSVYCPFITYGGTMMLTTYVLFGILLSVYRYQNVTGELRTEKKLVFTFRIDEKKYN